MAMRSNTSCLRSTVSRLTRSSTFVTSTTPKMKPQLPAADFGHHTEREKAGATKGHGAFLPVYVAIGMILLSVGFGTFTVIHQLKRAPNVYIRKSRRETLPELVEPGRVAEDSDKFLRGSFFRKIAHIQDFENQGVIPDPIRGDAFSCRREERARAVTLKDVGVDPVEDTADPRLPGH